ncbi:MAG TPA: adenylate/guanylate cyclase domain-containing protein [Candidatus Limnocylindria bacterium]|nr:adenylate/guanylate cyclase domain-containing protein [Candidatus Limnocylindria bacterium]
MTQASATTLEAAREAIARHDWEAARAGYLEAEHGTRLGGDDLEQLGEAHFWAGYPEESIDALERAYAAHAEAGEKTQAAGVALRLFFEATNRLAMRAAVGWLRRAQRMLEGEPPSAVNGVLHMFDGFRELDAGDPPAAYRKAEEARDLGRQFGDRDVEVFATNLMGQALIRQGQVDEGLVLIDESASAAAGGELGPWVTAGVYCATMGACRDLSDWQRAGEWAEEADREMRRQAISGYPGVCRVHRAEVKRLRGDWGTAEQEVRQACVDLERYRLLWDLGWAFYELGENLRQRGDLPGAAEAYQRAHEYGRDPEPGIALLKLAQGEREQAVSAISRALRVKDEDHTFRPAGDSPTDPLGRSHLLPAQVEIALAAGDLETAEAAATELEEISTRFHSTALQATAAGARGAVLLARGDATGAVEALLRSRHLWQIVGAPYETARARMLLATAYLSTGEETNAALELETARSTFERLGAAPDLRRIEAELERQGAARHGPAGARVTRTFMFTDIVTSTELLEALGDEAWEKLIGWHDTTLRAIVGEHGGEEVSHTGDGFFVAFEDPRPAIDAAVAIQRRLGLHRRDHGFAPWLRIGLHTAPVSRVADNYRGVGVHVAARVSALAEREQVLASAATLDAAGSLPYPVSERSAATLKGIKGVVEVASIAWQ